MWADKVLGLDEQGMQVCDALQILCLTCQISLYSVRSSDINLFEFGFISFLSPVSMNTD